MPCCQIFRSCYWMSRKERQISIMAEWRWTWSRNPFLWAAISINNDTLQVQITNKVITAVPDSQEKSASYLSSLWSLIWCNYSCSIHGMLQACLIVSSIHLDLVKLTYLSEACVGSYSHPVDTWADSDYIHQLILTASICHRRPIKRQLAEGSSMLSMAVESK